MTLEWSSDHLSVPSEAQHECGKRVVEAASYDHLTAERAVPESGRGQSPDAIRRAVDVPTVTVPSKVKASVDRFGDDRS